MKKIFVLVALVAVLVGATSITALAGFTWCSTDPNIQLPDGGVFHLKLSVPTEYRDVGFVLDVWAPEGSRLVGNTGAIAVTVNLHTGKAGEIKAKPHADFPVMLEGILGSQSLGTSIFNSGKGTAIWHF